MSRNRRQHYVPKFLLRRFAHADGRSIDLFNLSNSRLIRGASLKAQAYRDWFYGRENLGPEVALGFIESKAASIIKEIDERGRTPTRYSVEHVALVRYVATQLGRTPAAEARSNEHAEKLGKLLLSRKLKTEPEMLKLLSQLEIKIPNTPLFNIRQSLGAAPILHDLHYKILRNESGLPFILSDAPAVLCNTLLFDVTDKAAVGLATSGLQIFLPVSPKSAIMFFDEEAYDVGKKYERSIVVRNIEQIKCLNELQWENARENLYIPPNTSAAYLSSSWEKWKTHRRTEVFDLDEFKLDGPTKNTIVTFNTKHPITRLNLPFVRHRMSLGESIERWAVPPIRNPDWVSFVRQAISYLESGSMTFMDFAKVTWQEFPPSENIEARNRIWQSGRR